MSPHHLAYNIPTPSELTHTIPTPGEALRTGVDGEIDDDLSFFKPWGFDVQDVKVPVFVYHGEIDPSAPFSHGQWLGKHIDARYVKTRFESGDGHVSIMRHVGQMLDEVKAVIGAVP